MKCYKYILLILFLCAILVNDGAAQTMPAIESAVRLTAIPTMQNPQTPQLPYSGITYNVIPFFASPGHPYYENGYTIENVKNRIILKILLEKQLGSKDFSVKVPVKIYYTQASRIKDSIVNKVLAVNYKVASGSSFKQIDLFQFEGGYEMTVEIQTNDIVFSSGLSSAEELTIKKAIELRSSITYNKVVEFDFQKVLRPPNIIITEHLPDNAIEICWDIIDGALEYDLEWVHTEGYEVSNASLFSFNENAARVRLSDNCYTMPIVYEEGYLSFRIRGRGIKRSISPKLMDGEWSWSWPSGTPVPPNRKYENIFPPLWASTYHIASPHENDNLNWQSVTSYAENGKRKDVVSYMDGTMRTRQTVTAVNSDKNALVAETFLDFEGRPAVQSLPVPVWNDMRLKFRRSFNQNTPTVGGGLPKPYSKKDFGYDPANCGQDAVSPMNNVSGSAYYYSSQFYNDLTPEEKESHLATIPHSFGYPFVHTEYTADNTGRISRQGGAGPQYQLGSGHETKYIYAVPFQEELNMLFGANVGFASHYKKNMVIDPNGQVSISYLDAKGNTIATSLAGESPDALDTLESYDASRITVDLLDKNLLNINNNSIDASFVLAVPKKGDYFFYYGITAEQFQDSCMAANVCYDCIYDLELMVVNSACGDTLFYLDTIVGALFDPLVNSGSGSSSKQYQLGGPSILGDGLSTCKQQPFVFDSDQLPNPNTFNLYNLDIGTYNVIKKLKVNEAATDAYVNHYINDTSNLCVKHLDDFLDEELAKVDTMDCMLDCESIEADEGPYNPDDRITTEIDEFKEAACDSLPDTPCEVARKMMIADLSPGGQYALYDDNFSAYDYPLSILNPNNKLAVDDFNRPIHYSNITFDQVDFVIINGQSENPKGLSLVNFITYYKEEWTAKYFLEYHPERCYLQRCDDIEASHDFDIKINEIQTYAEAKSLGYIDIVSNELDQNKLLFKSDPYYLNPIIYNPPLSNQKMTLLKELSNFAGPGSGISFDKFTIFTVFCDNQNYSNIPPVIYPISPTLPLVGNPPAPCQIPQNTSTEERDLLWQTYRAFYITAKNNAEYKIRTEYAIENECYNECIGQEEFNPVINDFMDDAYTCPPNIYNSNYGIFGSHTLPWGAFACDVQPCNYRVYPYYQKKMKRFPSIYDAMRTMDFDFYNTPRADVFNNLLNGIVAEESYDCKPCVDTSDIATILEDLFLDDVLPSYDPGFQYGDGDLMASIDYTNDVIKNIKVYYMTVGIAGFGVRIVINDRCTLEFSYSRILGNYNNCDTNWISNPDFEWGNPLNGGDDIHQAYDVVNNNGWRNIWQNGGKADFFSATETSNSPLNPNTGQMAGFKMFHSGLALNREGVINTLKHTILPNTGKYMLSFDIAATYSDPPILEVIGVSNPNNSYSLNPINVLSPLNIDLFGAANSFSIGQYNTYAFSSYPLKFERKTIVVDSDDPNFNLNGITHIMILTKNDINCGPCSGYVYLDNFQLCHQDKLGNAYAIESLCCLSVNPNPLIPNGEYTMSFQVTMDDQTTHIISGTSSCKFDCDSIPPDTTIACKPLPIARELRHLLHNISFNQNPNLAIISGPVSHGFIPRPMIGNTIIDSIGTSDKTNDYFSFTMRRYKEGFLFVLDSTQCGIYLNYSNIQSPYKVSDIVLYTSITPDYSQKNIQGNTYFFDLEVMYSDGTIGNITGEGLSCFPVGRCCVPIPTSQSKKLKNKKRKSKKITFGKKSKNIRKYKKDVLNSPSSPSSPTPNDYDPLCDDCPKVGFVGGIFEDVDIITDCNAIFCADTFEIIEYGNINQDCIDFLYAVAEANAYTRHEQYIDSIAKDVRARYIKKCLQAVEEYTGDFGYSQHHFTLYYYNQSNNLVQTVPPNGKRTMTPNDMQVVKQYQDDIKAHQNPTMPVVNATDTRWASEYNYNSLNQLHRQKIPDHGEVKQSVFVKSPTLFWYDLLGRLVVSNNPEQRGANPANAKYSYTIYDDLGRISQAGEIKPTTFPPSNNLTNQAYDTQWANFIGGPKTQITTTTYDTPYYGTIPPLGSPQGIPGENLRGRVAAAAYYETQSDLTNKKPDYVTHYSYDIHGNVNHLVQQPKDFRRKTIDYDYDLISGNVNSVYYQKDQIDQFIHKYAYDADNRLTLVRTSRDGLIWQEDAKYLYYPHGPLARVELGQEEVQGLDYAYTLQGWIKGMNSASLSAHNDIGYDAIIGHKNQNFAHDEVGFILNYNQNDFSSISGNTGAQSFETNFNMIDDRHGLYNGNIRSMTTAIQALMPNNIPAQYSYQYDQLNRIKAMQYHQDFEPSANQWKNSTNSNPPTLPQTMSDVNTDYRTSYTYDGNGNILTLERDGVDHTNTAKDMDRFDYNYMPGTNRLTHVDDDQSLSINYPHDLDDQNPNNYDYDRNGNMTSDIAEGIQNIDWNLQGKVSKITKTNGKELTFRYDALGNRISKTYQDTTIYYFRDASGNAMAHYKHVSGSNTVGNLPKVLQMESALIYGSSRLGMYQPKLDLLQQTPSNPSDNLEHRVDSKLIKGQVQYELTNHLGNVLATVSDVKRRKPVLNAQEAWYFVDVGSASDYYPGGMLMPGKNTSMNTQRYKHQGQESDDEISGLGNNYFYKYRMSDARLNRFWSVDPLSGKYPYYSTYSFSGNRLIDANEFEGLEPKVKNNRLVGYIVKSGQGPSQIAKDINNPDTQKEYGYTLLKPVTYISIIRQNFETFKKNANIKDIGNKNDPGYTKMNINKGDEFAIFYQGYESDVRLKKSQKEREEKRNMTFNSEFWNLDSEKMLQDVDDFELLEKVLFLALDVYLFFKTPYSLNPPDGDFTLDLEIKGRLRANGNGSNIVVPIINFNGDHISDKYPLLNIKGAKVGTKSYKYRNDGTVKGKFEIKIDDYTKTGNHNKT